MFLIVISLSGLVINLFLKDQIENNTLAEMVKTNEVIVDMLSSNLDNSIQVYLRTRAMETLKNTERYYQKYSDGLITEEEAYEKVREIILHPEHGKIGDTGYLAGVSGTGILVIHPASEGVDASGHDFMQQAISMKSGYIEYMWQNPDDESPRAKAGALEYFEPWDLIIWASSYKSEFSNMINKDDFKETLLSIKFGETGYAYVIDTKGKLIIHPELEGENIFDSVDEEGRYFIREIIENKQGTTYYAWQNPGEPQPREKVVFYDYIENLEYIVATSTYTEEMFAILDIVFRILAATLVTAVIVAIGISYLQANAFSRPITNLKNATEEIIKGNYSQQVAVSSNDEIGDLSRAFNNMITQIQKNYDEIMGLYKGMEAKVQERTRELSEKNKQITDSIDYAKKIQLTILPEHKLLKKNIPEFFIIYRPKDIIGGDFYWFKELDKGFLLALIDCTGHGVPGAFMTMLTHSSLESILDEMKGDDPSAILKELNIRIKKMLHSVQTNSIVDDGLDIALCYVEPGKKSIIFAGTRLSIFYYSDDEVTEIKGDKQSIGYQKSKEDYQYTNHYIKTTAENTFYLVSDGLLDQSGGEKKLPFGKKRFRSLIGEIHKLETWEQKNRIETSFSDYSGSEEQRDDITLLGFKV